jgi:hypothetical protein
MVEYLSGNRIQGTSTLTSAPPQTSWKEVGRETLSAGATSITCSFTPKDNHMVLYSRFSSTSPTSNGKFRLGYDSVDSGSNYSERYSHYGNSDTTQTSQDGFAQWDTGGIERLDVMEFANIAGKEKLAIGSNVVSSNGGAGTAPYRVEYVGKWANTSNQANRIYWENSYSGGGGLAAGTEIIVLGCNNDEADSGTNFWQELADVSLSSAGDTIDSGTFTAKKYLWIEVHGVASSDISFKVRFNGDTGSNYAFRSSLNGGSDGTDTGESYINVGTSFTGTADIFGNMFIINKAANEKFVISECGAAQSGAGNAPERKEVVGKWANTSAAITNITIHNSGSGDFASGSTLKVWGSD